VKPDTDRIALVLNGQRTVFKAFLVARVGNEADAEDILQDGLVKALRHAREIKDTDKAPAWFYRLLRNAVTDHYRSRAAGSRRTNALGTLLTTLGEDMVEAPKGWEAQVCGCLGSVVDSLKPPQAELLRRVDLGSESVQEVAKALKLTPNNASVMLHRARQELRARLETFCGACADGACLDCDCSPTSPT
jgi:RNA polymerase sigma-70 factor (ECF subfamily)